MTDRIKLDLDALVPEAAEITIGGEKIMMTPPTVEQILKMTRVTNEFGDIEKHPEKISDFMDKISEIIYEIIPSLKGKELGLRQIMALIDLIMELSMPDKGEKVQEDGSKVEIISPNEKAA
jgi:hypothetical protein